MATTEREHLKDLDPKLYNKDKFDKLFIIINQDLTAINKDCLFLQKRIDKLNSEFMYLINHINEVFENDTQ